MSTGDQRMPIKPIRSKKQLKKMVTPAEKCPRHTHKYFEVFCLTHLEKCCETCSKLHTSCKTLSLGLEIEEEATRLNKQFKERFSILQNKAGTLINNVKVKRNLLERSHADLIEAIKKMRKGLDETLDKLEESIKIKADQLKALEENKLEYVTKMLDDLDQDLEKLRTVIDQTEHLQTTSSLTDMILKIKSEDGMKKAENILKSTQEAMAKDDVKGYTFMPNLALIAALQKADVMGTFYPDIWIEHSRDFSVKTTQDTCHAWITGTTALQNKIIVADSGNYKIKMFDDKTLDLTSELSLASWPWAVTKVSQNRFATTVPLIKKIHIVKIDEGLCIEKDIATSHKCSGLAHWDGKLIVSYCKKNKIEIIDMISGTVLHSIKNEAKGEKYINFPEYITLGPDNQTIFISNFLANSILKYGLEGKMKGSYTRGDLVQPRQTMLDKNGIIYISGYGSGSIHLMTTDLQKIKVLYLSTEILFRPRGVCLSEEGSKLFVDMSPNTVRVFDVSSALF